MGQEAWGIFCPREVYPSALHQSKAKVQQRLPPHPAHHYHLLKPLCASSGCFTQQDTQLAAPPATLQVQASNQDQHPLRAHSLHVGCLPTGFEASVHYRCTPSHHNWLPCLVGPPFYAIFFKKGLGTSSRKYNTIALEPSPVPTKPRQYKASRQKWALPP